MTGWVIGPKRSKAREHKNEVTREMMRCSRPIYPFH